MNRKSLPVIRLAVGAVTCLLLFSSTAPRALAQTHTVKAGENLVKIAAMYGVSVDEIAALNGIDNKNLIRIGSELTIPDVADTTDTNDTADADATDADAEGFSPASSADPSVSGGQPTAGTGPADKRSSEVSFRQTAATFSLHMVNADIRDVLSAVALNMGANIVYKGEAAKVSIKLNDVTIDEALEYITKVAGLTYIKDGSVMIVGSRDGLSADFGDQVQIAEFNLKYITSETLKSQITALGIRVNSLRVDSNNKSLWVQGFATDLIKIRQVITMLDKNANIELGSAQIMNNFKAISVEYISADEFRQILGKLSLPSGFTLENNPSVLYIYASQEDFRAIEGIRKIVDVIDNYSLEGSYAESGTMEKVQLTYVPKEAAVSLLTQMNLEVQVVTSERMQKSVWLAGRIDAILKAKEILKTIDLPNAGIPGSFEVFRLYNITALEMANKIALLDIPEIRVYTFAYPEFSKSILIACQGDYISTISQVIDTLDQDSPTVILPIDASTVEDGYSRLSARRTLIAELSGIPVTKFKISSNIAKTAGYRYVLYLEESPEEIARVKQIIAQIDGV